MKKSLIFLLSFSAISLNALAQLGNITASKAGHIYLLGGYTRAWFSKSDIRLKGYYPDSPSIPDAARGQAYNFVLQGAKALDHPEINSLDAWNLTSPQFYFRLGYLFYGEYINGIELGLDHFSYSLKPDQTLRVQGMLYDSLSQEVNSVERDMIVTDDFVHFEHSNGLNYLMLSFVRGMYLYRNRTETHMITCLVKPGVGITIPRSDVSVYGDRKEDVFHVGGYVAGLEVAFRYTAAEQFFIETSAKGCYANFSDVVTVPKFSSTQTFTTFQWSASIGYLFRL